MSREPSKETRNAEIWRRVSMGETQTAVAREYGISTSRAHKVYSRAQGKVMAALRNTNLAGQPHHEPLTYGVWFEYEPEFHHYDWAVGRPPRVSL